MRLLDLKDVSDTESIQTDRKDSELLSEFASLVFICTVIKDSRESIVYLLEGSKVSFRCGTCASSNPTRTPWIGGSVGS